MTLRFVEDEDAAWMQHGACLGTDVDLFFPERGGNVGSAKAVCLSGGPCGEPCPVLDECREYALRHGEKFGVWGGLSERERRVIRRRRRLESAA